MDKLLTPEEVGELLGMTPQQLATARYAGNGPAFRRLNARVIRYTEADVANWLETTRRTRTDDPALSA